MIETEKRELVSKPGDEFTSRIHRLLGDLDELRLQELEDPNVTIFFQRVLVILFGELQPYLETPEEKELIPKKERIEQLPFGFSNRQVSSSLSGGVVFEWDKPNGFGVYKLKWKLLSKLEFGLRSCIRRCNFDVLERIKITKPYA